MGVISVYCFVRMLYFVVDRVAMMIRTSVSGSHDQRKMSLRGHLSRVCASCFDREATMPFATDWLKKVVANPNVVVCQPQSTPEVTGILRFCNREHIPVVSQGGNTGLVQASVPHGTEPAVILSTRRLNSIAVNTAEQVVICGAGCILQEAQRAAAQEGLVFPLDMGSKGTCTVGGNAATNAGGIHVIRYGSFRSNIVGLEAVLANGDVIDELRTLRKDNTGYDLKQLMIGSEGTLGVITRCAVALHPQPHSTTTLKCSIRNVDDLLHTFEVISKLLGPALGAFEVMDAEGLRSTGCSHDETSFTAVVDVLHYGCQHDVLPLLASSLRESVEAEVAQNGMRQREMWSTREDLPVRLAALGPIYKFDLSLARRNFFGVVDVARRCARVHNVDDIVITGYGHFGDGNVHLNVVDPTKLHTDFICTTLTNTIYEFVVHHNGSISAEHGIGHEKKKTFLKTTSPETLQLMRLLKHVCDPNNILNPGAIL
jgi:D-2-hydroxyglutarate dehydrogenase